MALLFGEKPCFGEDIKDYEVQDSIGKGGFAVVYKARCLKTGNEVAIKKIDSERMRAANMVARVLQEVEIHSRLKHPSIVELYTFFEDKHHVYLVLELCHNGAFQNYLKAKGTLSDLEASRVVREVVEGVLYLQSHNIAHRDLSLSNLLLTSDMRVKIADFGLATQLARSSEKHYTMCGTPNFISPEVATRCSHGLETDVWAIGCMLYTLLVGRPPFDSSGVQSTLTRVAMDLHKVPAHISPDAKDLIDLLLRKNPEDRIKLPDILTHPFMKHCMLENILPELCKRVSLDSGRDSMCTSIDSPRLVSDGHLSHIKSRAEDGSCHSCGRAAHNAGRSSSLSNVSQRQFSGRSVEAEPRAKGPCKGSHGSDVGERRHESVHKADCSGGGSAKACACEEQSRRSRSRRDEAREEGRPCCEKSSLHSCGSQHRSRQRRSSESSGAGSLPCQEHDGRSDRRGRKGLAPCCGPGLGRSPPDAKKPPQLCTRRLLPNKFRSKALMLSLLDSGDVVVERIKKHRIVDVCWISADGLRVAVYQPGGGKGVPVKDTPLEIPEQGADYIYNYESLPTKCWRMYHIAFRFVTMLKERTTKITYYSEKAKCYVMENGDFEVTFYTGGKITRTAEEVHVIGPGERKVTVQLSGSGAELLCPATRLLWNHYEECYNYCSCLEGLLTEQDSSGRCFPAILGQRRVPSLQAAATAGEEGAASPGSAPSTHQMFNTSSVTSGLPPSETKAAGQFSRKLEGLTLTTLPDGQVEVRYPDGCRLAVRSDGAGDVRFTDREGRSWEYGRDGAMPDMVRERLEQFPAVLRRFTRGSATR
ncbi:serine/threonine-protein kinase PLK4 isoform X2 [Bacillus rossius redtenbacheri]|uniref:serine/threonine-protein kinase PLK4 isoform X2 n=1 Tax=Bacillus rossius redtenbacheri TaxID=93214 RepID=UPI002FDC9393